MRLKLPKVLFVGPLPPPMIGPTLATEILLNSSLKEDFQLIPIDTSDHRDISMLGIVDLHNILIAFKHYWQLVKCLVSQKPRMVYIPISQTTIGYLRDSIFILLSRAFGKKVVCHLRGGNFKNWYRGASRLTRWYVRFIQRRVAAQIVLGECLRGMFAGIMPEERIFVVPNGRDFDFDFSKRREGDGKLRVLFLANFIPSKGIADVLKSVPIVTREFAGVQFLFAGSKRDQMLQVWIDEFLRSHPELPITMVGPIQGRQKYELLRSADIFVFPTYYPAEGHPWVIVEAMAAGLPVITTDQGAIVESVVDSDNGFIVPKQNPERIAEKVLTLAKDTELRTRMGSNSRKRYEEKFTEAKMVEKLSDCFNRVLDVRNVEYWFTQLSEQWWKNYSYGKKHFLRRMEIVHSLLDDRRGYSRILDIGCGTGEIISSLSERFQMQTTGIDISKKMIDYCRKNYPAENLSFLEGDIQRLDFPDHHFDLVLSLSVIEWIEDYERAIHEVARVLTKDGRWIVSIPNWRSPFRKLEYFRSLVFKRSYLKYQRNRIPIGTFMKSAEKCGLRLVKSVYHVRPYLERPAKSQFGRWLSMMTIMSLEKASL